MPIMIAPLPDTDMLHNISILSAAHENLRRSSQSNIDQEVPETPPITIHQEPVTTISSGSHPMLDTSVVSAHLQSPLRSGSDIDLPVTLSIANSPIHQESVATISTGSDLMVDTSLAFSDSQSQIAKGPAVSQQLPVTPVMPNEAVPQEHVSTASTGAETSLLTGQPPIAGGPVIFQELPVTPSAHVTADSRNIGIDPSIVFHEGWGFLQDAPHGMSSHGATLGLDDNDKTSGDGGTGTMDMDEDMQNPETGDIEMGRHSSEDPEEKSSQNAEEQSQDPASDDSEDDVMQDGEDEPVDDYEDVMQDGADEPVDDQDGRDQPFDDQDGGDQSVHDQDGGDQPLVPKDGGNADVQDVQPVENSPNKPSELPSPKPTLRPRQHVPQYRETATNLPKKRMRSVSTSDSETDTDGSVIASPAKVLEFETNAILDPESLREFVSLRLHIF
jgi:hypothetical protein